MDYTSYTVSQEPLGKSAYKVEDAIRAYEQNQEKWPVENLPSRWADLTQPQQDAYIKELARQYEINIDQIDVTDLFLDARNKMPRSNELKQKNEEYMKLYVGMQYNKAVQNFKEWERLTPYQQDWVIGQMQIFFEANPKGSQEAMVRRISELFADYTSMVYEKHKETNFVFTFKYNCPILEFRKIFALSGDPDCWDKMSEESKNDFIQSVAESLQDKVKTKLDQVAMDKREITESIVANYDRLQKTEETE